MRPHRSRTAGIGQRHLNAAVTLAIRRGYTDQSRKDRYRINKIILLFHEFSVHRFSLHWCTYCRSRMRISPFRFSAFISGPPLPTRPPVNRSERKTNLPLRCSPFTGRAGNELISKSLKTEPLNVFRRKSAASPRTNVSSTFPLTDRKSDFSFGFSRKLAFTPPFTVRAWPEPPMSCISTPPFTLCTEKAPLTPRTFT